MPGLLYDADAYDRYNYARTNMFTLELVNLPNANIIVHSVSGLVGYQINVLTLNSGNEPMKIAERPELGEVTIGVHVNVEKQALPKAWQWFLKVYDPQTQTVGYAYNYKSDGELTLMTCNGEPVHRWKLEGCWPSSLELDDTNYDDVNILNFNMILQVDRVYLLQ